MGGPFGLLSLFPVRAGGWIWVENALVTQGEGRGGSSVDVCVFVRPPGAVKCPLCSLEGGLFALQPVFCIPTAKLPTRK